jgi:hypothetical protein
LWVVERKDWGEGRKEGGSCSLEVGWVDRFAINFFLKRVLYGWCWFQSLAARTVTSSAIESLREVCNGTSTSVVEVSLWKEDTGIEESGTGVSANNDGEIGSLWVDGDMGGEKLSLILRSKGIFWDVWIGAGEGSAKGMFRDVSVGIFFFGFPVKDVRIGVWRVFVEVKSSST